MREMKEIKIIPIQEVIDPPDAPGKGWGCRPCFYQQGISIEATHAQVITWEREPIPMVTGLCAEHAQEERTNLAV